MNQSDHSEAMERARQEWLKSLPECIGYDGGCDGGLLNEPHEDNCPMKGHLDPNPSSTWDAAYEAGRRSLEQERWISVEERLPDFRVPVIVQGGAAELRIDGWWTYMECPMRCIQWKVTHWQPIPAPPVHKGDS